MIVSSQKDSDKKQFEPKLKSKAVEELNTIISPLEEGVNLRPSSIKDYIGQEKIVKQLKLIVESAKIRSTMPEHILLHGQPGLGKTTLASLITHELGATLKTVAAPALQKTGDVVSLLINLEENTILFIDEIHRLKAPLEEVLYSAMEDKVVDIVMGKGQGLSLGRFDLNSFMLVGATTQLGKLSKPLKDRFPTIFLLEPYTESEILSLIDRNVELLNLGLSDEAKLLICRRCRGVPRIANNILKRFLDLQIVHNTKTIDKITAEEFLMELGIFEQGLTKSDFLYLKALLNGTLALKTLSGILMEDMETLETVIEPYLIYLGFIDKTSGGRRLTPKGRTFIAGDKEGYLL